MNISWFREANDIINKLTLDCVFGSRDSIPNSKNEYVFGKSNIASIPMCIYFCVRNLFSWFSCDEANITDYCCWFHLRTNRNRKRLNQCSLIIVSKRFSFAVIICKYQTQLLTNSMNPFRKPLKIAKRFSHQLRWQLFNYKENQTNANITSIRSDGNLCKRCGSCVCAHIHSG